jgi:hypothetical protein
MVKFIGMKFKMGKSLKEDRGKIGSQIGEKLSPPPCWNI